jgi:peptide/nickel transport system permease protein
LMRLVDVLLSVPSLLLVLFVQAVFGKNIIGMSAAIGLCGWFSMAKIVRTQAKTVKESGFVTASQCMGGGFFHVA